MLIQLIATTAFALSDLLVIIGANKVVLGEYLILVAVLINWIGFCVLTVTLVYVADL
jgi:hypothetical protein